MTAIEKPLSVSARCRAGTARAGAAATPSRAACFQRSGSRTKMRTTNATSGRDQAAQEDVAPRGLGAALEPDAGDLIVHERRQEQAHRRRRVEQRARLDAPLFGHDLGDHGRARRPLAADAQAGDDAEERPAPRGSAPPRTGPFPARRAAWSASASACARGDRRPARTGCRPPPSRAAAATSAAPSRTGWPSRPRASRSAGAAASGRSCGAT